MRRPFILSITAARRPLSVAAEFYLAARAFMRQEAIRAASLFLVPALLLASCAATGLKVPAQSVTDGARVLEKVPFYPQKEHQCGPSSLAEVLNYYGAKTDAAAIARAIYSRTARGTLDMDMPIYAVRAGFRARQYRGTVQDIRKEIAGGRPLVVFVDYGFWVYQRGHFMVVVGYDKDGVIVHTEDTPFKHVDWRSFLGTWKKTGYWTLLITPKESGSKLNVPRGRTAGPDAARVFNEGGAR